jgi:molybdopterin converting factor subunit 1
MVVRVRLFAMLRERAGRDSLDLDLAEGSTTADAIAVIRDRTGLREIFDGLPVAVAVNREYVRKDVALADGDEVALIPPVSGGDGAREEDVNVRVGDGELSVDRLSRLVGRPGAGAVVTFAGTTREVARLEYEAYVEMAEPKIHSILVDVQVRHGLEAVAAEHRVGTVPLGEPSVVVAVSAAHRAEAFAGAREAIDRIKAEAPIWKREVTIADGSERRQWVQGEAPQGA